jgi:hypothetical protein
MVESSLYHILTAFRNCELHKLAVVKPEECKHKAKSVSGVSVTPLHFGLSHADDDKVVKCTFAAIALIRTESFSTGHLYILPEHGRKLDDAARREGADGAMPPTA